jgi:hypothetical protein
VVRRYRSLDPAKVIETITALHRRITERFSGAGLGSVCAELLAIAKENSDRARAISNRSYFLRLVTYALLLVGAVALVWIVQKIDFSRTSADSVFTLLQGIEAAANLVVLVGAGVFFLVTMEERLKRRRALRALNELRSIVHVIDMHQLTKDPSVAVSVGDGTPSSPPRTLSRFELTRYLDYCSEMVSLTSKVAVLFAQALPDPTVTDAVSDIERVAVGLSQKIWQKIVILETLGHEGAQSPSAATAPAQA